MVSSPHQQGNLGREIPKELAGVAPPPYTPPRQPALSLQSLIARGMTLPQIAQSLSNQRLQQAGNMARTISSQVLPDADTDAGTDEETAAPLSLRINTSINISKNNNLVCLSETPSNHASAIAEAVTQAIQNNSSGNCGIPMIDGNGNPRPVNIEVDAGVVVEGQGNIVGNESIVLEVLRQREEARCQRDASLRRPRSEDEEGETSNEAKRRRSE